MALPPVSRDRIVDAMRSFDVEQRDKVEWQNSQSNANYEHAIQFEGRLYPVKQIISMATGMSRDTFSGGPESNSYVGNLGFQVVRLRDDAQQYLLLRSMPGARWQLVQRLS